MDEPGRVRAAMRRHLDDVAPAAFAERIQAQLDAVGVAPGVLTQAAAATGTEPVAAEAVDDRAAAVQLIYAGLHLTRRLISTTPWEAAPLAAEAIDADVEILIADVLVARGMRELAQTPAAGAAVEVVRSFGTGQRNRLEGEPPSDGLEAGIIRLAVIAGVSLHRRWVPADVIAAVQDDGLPEPTPSSAMAVTRRLRRLLAVADQGAEHAASSVSDS
jgi:hypothetical protein